MTKLRVALIGCGSIAPVHAAAIAKSELASLVAVADVDGSRAQAFSEEWKCEYTTNYQDLIARDDIDVVHICTPHFLHAVMAEEAIRGNKHVLVEKPVAINVEDGARVATLAEQSGKQYGVVFQNRYNESSVQIKAWLDSGKLGNLVGMRAFVTWKREASYYASGAWRGKWATEGGGVLINQTIHTLDLLQWFGGPVTNVSGQASTLVLNDVIEVEDTAHAILEFESGARAVFFATVGHVVDSPVYLEVICENGTLIQRRESLYLYKDQHETLLCEPPEQGHIGKSYWGIGHARCIEDFYQSILSSRPFTISGREGLKALRIVKDIQQSYVHQ